jgi:hypothetical protein
LLAIVSSNAPAILSTTVTLKIHLPPNKTRMLPFLC